MSEFRRRLLMQKEEEGGGGVPSGKYVVMVSYGGTGKIFYSSDFGATFQIAPPKGKYQDVAISGDGKYILAVGYDVWTSSSDYGNTWVQDWYAYGNYYSCAMSYDGKYQIAATQSHEVKFSSDYGASWKPLTNFGGDSRRVDISDNGKYIIVVSNTGCYLSSDYANTFVNVFPQNEYPSSVAMSGDGKYIYISERTYNLKSQDYGKTWIKDTTIGNIDFAVSKDGKVVYQIGYSSLVSEDFGNSWISINPPTISKYISTSATGDMLIIAPYNGQIFPIKSVDFGRTWTNLSEKAYFNGVAINK